MRDYVVLDLETPNRFNDSISSIGIVIVEEGEVVDKIYTLINPEQEFDEFNINFTGIHPYDVVDSPTFDEYWQDIKSILCSNVIVGQNITFDLRVISKSLTNYNIPLPAFRYYCTLNSCRRNLNLQDNSLSYIARNVLHSSYNAHNAMDDALMTNKLYNYLSDYDRNRLSHVSFYTYQPNCKRDFNRKLDLKLNYLYGLVQKFNYCDDINLKHMELMEQWYLENEVHCNHPLFENILLKLSYPIQKKKFSKRDRLALLKTVNLIQRSPVYKTPILKLGAFRGIIDSLSCYDMERKDIDFIQSWLKSKPINDNTFKKFYKELDFNDIENAKENLMEFSHYIQDYI